MSIVSKLMHFSKKGVRLRLKDLRLSLIFAVPVVRNHLNFFVLLGIVKIRFVLNFEVKKRQFKTLSLYACTFCKFLGGGG